MRCCYCIRSLCKARRKYSNLHQTKSKTQTKTNQPKPINQNRRVLTDVFKREKKKKKMKMVTFFWSKSPCWEFWAALFLCETKGGKKESYLDVSALHWVCYFPWASNFGSKKYINSWDLFIEPMSWVVLLKSIAAHLVSYHWKCCPGWLFPS